MTTPSLGTLKQTEVIPRAKSIKQTKRQMVDNGDSLQNQIDDPNQVLAQNTSQDTLQDVPQEATQDAVQEVTPDVPQDTVQDNPQDPISESAPIKTVEPGISSGNEAIGGAASGSGVAGGTVIGGTVGTGESSAFALSNVVGVVGGVSITAGGLLAAGGGVVALAVLGGGGGSGSTPVPATTAVANTYSYAGTIPVTNIVEGVNGGVDTVRTTATADLSALTVNGAADLEGAGADEGIEQIIIASGTPATFNGAQLSGNTIAINESAAGTTNLIINVATGTTATFANLTFGAFAGSDAFDDGADTITINGAGGAENITGTSFADIITGGLGNDTIAGGGGADTLNGGLNDDTFVFATIADLNAAVIINGGAGNDLIQMTAAATLADTDFTTSLSIETLGLTGASTVTLGINANTAGIVNVTTGTGVTNLTSTDIATLNINAAALAQNTLLTLAGDTTKIITGLVGDLQASGLTAVITGDAADNGISVTTGSAATSITASGAGDVISTNAAALTNNNALTLIGSAAATVTGLIGDVVASNLTGTLSGALSITTGNNTIDQTISITTGSAATSITANGASDVISTNAAALADNNALTLIGSAAATVTGLVGNVLASGLTGALNVTTGAVAELSIATGSGSNTINASALLDNQVLTLTGSTAATVTLLNGDLAASAYTGNIVVTATTGSHAITTGSGNDTFNFASQVNLAAAVIINGGVGNDRIQMTGPVTLTDTDFKNPITGETKVIGIETLGLTGANTITLGLHANNAGIVNVITGSGATSLTSTDIASLNVTASALGNDVVLSMFGSSAATVNLSSGDLAASTYTGDLTVTATNGTNAITTGSGSDTISGGAGVDAINAGTGFNTIIVNGGHSSRLAVTGNGNDIGQDTITGFDLTTDTLRVVATGVTNFVHGGTQTTIGTAGGGIDGFTSTSYTNLTGLVSLDGNATFIGGNDVVVTFVAPTGLAFDETNFEARLEYNLTGDLGGNTLTGGLWNDILSGGEGDDTLTGDLGDDTLTGGLGDDTLTGGDGSDTFAFNAVVGLLGVSSDSLGGFRDTILDFNTDEDFILLRATEVSNFSLPINVRGVGGHYKADLIATFLTGDKDTGVGAVDWTNITAQAATIVDLTGTAGNDILGGGGNADTLKGGAGNDILTGGGGGTDILTGGAGADTFVFNAVVTLMSNDVVPVVLIAGSSDSNGGVSTDTITDFEAGTDFVLLRATNINNFSVADNVIVDTATSNYVADLDPTDSGDVIFFLGTASLTNKQAQDTTIVDLTGTAGADTLVGGINADTLTGGLGADILEGGESADTFIFNAVMGISSDSTAGVQDRINDFTTGTDTILLRATNVSNFNVATDVTGAGGIYTANLDKDVNNLGDIVFSSAVIGTNAIAQAATVVDLLGSINGGDILSGGDNNDTLNGDLGSDTLTGGLGADQFVFDSALGIDLATGLNNIDTITDFTVGIDHIMLEHAAFDALAALGIPGVAIDANNFFSGTDILDTSGATGIDINGISLGVDDYIKYDTGTGNLFYDADGNGTGAMVQFATLSNIPTDLTATSFIFI